MTGPQYPGQTPEGQDPQFGQTPQYGQPQYGQTPQYGAPQYGQQPQYGQPEQPGSPDLSKGGDQASYPPPGQYPAPGQYPPPQAGQYPPQGNYPPPPPVGQQPYGEPGIYSTAGQPAGAGVRLGARIIDGLIVGIPVGIVNLIVAYSLGGIASYVVGIVLSLVPFAYFVYLESTKGQTFGKQLLSLRTVGPDGNKPTQDVAIRRNAWLLLNALSSLLSILFILSGLVGLASLALIIAIGVTISNDPNKQGIHDKFAGGTRVVRA